MINANEINSSRPELTRFHFELTTFLSRLNDRKPETHPMPPFFSPTTISKDKLARFVSQSENKEAVDNGYAQLLGLKNLILKCANSFKLKT